MTKYNYNTELFINPNEITYYLLGAFISDGCVDQNLRKITISSKDDDWLSSIAKILCPEKSIQKIKKSNCFVLRIHNKQIVNWFINNECTPRKSLTVKMPNIPKQYLSHFMRGVFDGDGCIVQQTFKRTKTKQIRIYIVSGSKIFAKQLSLILNDNNIKNNIITINNNNKSIMNRPSKNYNDCYRIVANSSNAVNFCKFIYKNKNIYLCRKEKIYKEYLNIRDWELHHCMIRKQFDDPNEILNMLHTHTYKEISNIYGVTIRTIVNRLQKLNLYDKAKQIKSIS